MSNLPYFPFYPSKWLGRTASLSPAERGIYITLICEMYERMEPLEANHKALARLCGTTPKTLEKAIEVLLKDENKLVLFDGCYWNQRVQKEIKNSKKKSEIAKKNASSRWGKDQQNQREGDADAKQAQCYPKPDTKYIYSFEKEKWFSEADETTLQAMHPNIDVAAKLRDETFRKWSFEADPSMPTLAAKNWFQKQIKIREGTEKLAKIIQINEPANPSKRLQQSRMMQ